MIMKKVFLIMCRETPDSEAFPVVAFTTPKKAYRQMEMLDVVGASNGLEHYVVEINLY